jgi:hypothetical protein
MENEEQVEKGKPARVSDSESETAVNPRDSGKKQDIWNEVLKMTSDKDTGVRKRAAELLSSAFPEAEGKSGVFFDLVKLTESQDALIRERAAELFTIAYVYSEDKQRAWDELVKLASAEDRKVRKGAVLALSSGYAEVPDKGKAWKEMISLSAHSDNYVKRAATRALGDAFFLVPDKTQAWRDMQAVTDSSYLYVRMYALRSLGKASLWRALRAEDETTYLFGLKEAVKYFKEASEISTETEIPDFYYPFYEDLLFILFSDIPGRAKLESERYPSKVTRESRNLEGNPQLFEVLKQLTGLLISAGDLAPGDLPAQKELLKTCILTFDRYSGSFERLEEKIILTQKTVKKEHLKPGKEILERVEKKKSFLSRKQPK